LASGPAWAASCQEVATVSAPTINAVAPARPAQMADVNHQGGRLRLSMVDPLDMARREKPRVKPRATDQAAGGGRA